MISAVIYLQHRKERPVKSHSTRARRGSGSVRQVGETKAGIPQWQLRYIGPDGKRAKPVYVTGTKTDADAELRRLTSDTDRGIATDKTLTFSQWADRWIAAVGPGLRPRSLLDYEYTVAHYLRPSLGRIKLVDLDESHVARLVARWQADGAAPGAIRKRVGFLRMILGRAVDAGKLPRNVARLVDVPAYRRQPINPPTRDDVARIMHAVAGTPDAPAYALAIGTGMRQGELLALRWSDVDLDTRTARVTASIAYGTAHRGATKTRASIRTVPLVTFVVDTLRAAGPGAPDAFIVATRTGRPLHARNLLRRFHRTLDDLGLPRYRWHDFRHYAATSMIEANVPLPTVMAILGHSTITTTVDTYGHLRTDGAAARAALEIDLKSSHKSSHYPTDADVLPRTK
jgi:integrase